MFLLIDLQERSLNCVLVARSKYKCYSKLFQNLLIKCIENEDLGNVKFKWDRYMLAWSMNRTRNRRYRLVMVFEKKLEFVW